MARQNSESPTDSSWTTPESDPEFVASSSRKQTYYELLGCAPDATRDEIKANYIALARKIHPDSRINREYCTETIPEFTDVATAWKVLRDPQLRLRYDRTLQSEKFVDSFEEKAESVLRNAFGKLELMADSVGTTVGNAAVAANRVGNAFEKVNSAFSKVGKKAMPFLAKTKESTGVDVDRRKAEGRLQEHERDMQKARGMKVRTTYEEETSKRSTDNADMAVERAAWAVDASDLMAKETSVAANDVLNGKKGQVKHGEKAVADKKMMTDNVKEAMNGSSVAAIDLVNGKIEVGESRESGEGPGANMKKKFWQLDNKAKRGYVKNEGRFNTGKKFTTGKINEAVNGAPVAEGDSFKSKEAKRTIQESVALGINITDTATEFGTLYQKAGQVKREGQSVVGTKGMVGKGNKVVNESSRAGSNVVNGKEDARSILGSGKAPDVDGAGVSTKFQPLDTRADRGKGSTMAEAASQMNPKFSNAQNAYSPAERAHMARAPTKAGERGKRAGSLQRDLSAGPLLSKVVPVDDKRAPSSSVIFNSTVPHPTDVSWHSKPESVVSNADPSSHFGGSAKSNSDVTAKRPVAPSGRPLTDAVTDAVENKRRSSPASKVAPGEARFAPFVASTPTADASTESANKSPAKWSAFGEPHQDERWSAFGVPPPHEH